MATEKRKHTPIEPPSPPQDNRQVDILPPRTRRPMPVVLTQRKRLSTHQLPQDNTNPIRPPKTVFRRLGHRDQTLPQPVAKPQQAAVCRNFQRRGHCKYGDKCIYLHQLPTGSDLVDQQAEQKGELKITRTTGSSSVKRTEKTESLRKVVLEETDRAAPSTESMHSSTYNEGKEYDEALLLERRRQEIKLELQRLEAEPKQKDQIISIQTTARSSPSEGEASSSSSDPESSDEQSEKDREASEEHGAQPRSAIIVPLTSDRPSRTSSRDERRPRSIVTPVHKTSRTVPAGRSDSRPISDKERERPSNDSRRDTARPGRSLLSERTTTGSQIKRPHTHSQRETARPASIRGPPLQSQEEQYRERRNEPLPTHSDPKRQESRRLPRRQDSNAQTAASSSTQPTSSSRPHQRNQLTSAAQDRSQNDRSRSREHQKQAQHKVADIRTRESAPTSSLSNTRKEKTKNTVVGEESALFGSRRSDQARRNQYLSETDDRVASDEHSRQDTNPRRSTRPKQFTELVLPAAATQLQRPQDLVSITMDHSHKRPPLSRHTTSISENLSSNKSIEFQRSDRVRAKESPNKKRSHDQLTVEDTIWQSKPQLEPPHKQSRKEWPRTRETKVHEEAYEGAKSQATVTIHDTEFAVDAISDDEEDAAVDQAVEQVTDDASDVKDQMSGTETPPSHTPTRADPEPADVEDENKGTKARRKFASYGESTGSIDERALPEAEELEDISDDELGDASSVSSAAHGGHHKLSAADWASLIELKQVHEKTPSSARQRFAPQNFLRTCAISSKYIPSALVAQIEQMCNMKGEQEDATVDTPKTAFRFLAESGAEHMARMREADALASPFQLVGVHRRALCARDDLRFRRRLCGYGPELADPSTTNEHGMPFLPSLFEKSKQLFVEQQKIFAQH